jgi:hypothetical protein
MAGRPDHRLHSHNFSSVVPRQWARAGQGEDIRLGFIHERMLWRPGPEPAAQLGENSAMSALPHLKVGDSEESNGSKATFNCHTEFRIVYKV